MKGCERMRNAYNYAKQIQRNIKLTSDNLSFADCYYLCAKKDHIDDLKSLDHQIIWGRRGTGKTTLLKAFTFDINNNHYSPNCMAIYIVMAQAIPTEDEIRQITGDGSSLALFVLSKIVSDICDQLEKSYSTCRKYAMDSRACNMFDDAFLQLTEHIRVYQEQARGGKVTVGHSRSEELQQESGINSGGQLTANKSILNIFASIFKKQSTKKDSRKSVEINGEIHFNFETGVIRTYLAQMLQAFGISTLYLCLDEFCDLDKISAPSIQIQVAELIKQVFFKTSPFSVKISSIWNRSNIYSRGQGRRAQGIEYMQDIFQGPDLDTMFMREYSDAQKYFKELIVNTYFLDTRSDEERVQQSGRRVELLSDYLVSDIFGEEGFSQIIVGSQGVSRIFAILIKTYLDQFINLNTKAPLKLERVYDMIKYNGPPVKTTDQEKIVNKTDFGCIPSQDRARQAGRQPPAKRVEEP